MPIATIRKSGNSTILVLPPEILKERKLKVGERVEYQIFKKVNLKKWFGQGRKLKLDAQQLKNELRKEW